MLSNYFFLLGTLLLSLNFIRPFGLAISDWFYFGALILMVLETMTIDKENAKVWIKNHFYIPAWFILFGAVISTFRATSAQVAVIEIIQQLYVITLFVSMIQIIVNRGKTNWVIRAFIISGVFTASVAIIDNIAGTRIGPMLSGAPESQFWYRYAGTLGHPNKLGYFLVLTSVLTLAHLSGEKTLRNRLFWIVLVIVQCFGIFLSGSVTAYIGLLTGFSALFFTFMHSQKKVINYAIMLILVFSIVYLGGEITGKHIIQFNRNINESVLIRSFSRVQTTTLYSRTEIYLQSLQRIIKSPVVGAGFDQISTSGIDVGYRELGSSVHNALLQIWYIGGIFALFGYIIIYIQLGTLSIKTLWNYQKRNLAPLMAGLAAATLATLVMDQFQDSVYHREKWLIIGLFVNLALINLENHPNK